jgi:hypothetical protein
MRSRPLFDIALLLAGGLMMFSGVSQATTYRWVNDQGQVHYSDVVPERYKSRARPLAPPPAEPTPEDRQQALERAARDRAQLDRAAAASKPAARPPVPPPGASSAAAGKRPAQVPTATTDCQTWQRLHQESADCFGPFRTVRGGIKPEAFEHCVEVPEPPPRCRPQLR